ncbi:MAG: SCO1664 family protein [Chloroflexi bacterium]|nr:SCO1664 family protein [Chloroflexota bacterium]
MEESARSTNSELSEFLLRGAINNPRLIPTGSNHAFLVTVGDGLRSCRAVYKPRTGERPLWDFPSGTLYKREYVAYLVATALGWDIVPVTVIREGPYGVGSLQMFVDADPRSNYFTLREECLEELEQVALFDCLSNNADRKASHCFKGRDGRLWCIDHGLTFHAQPKLRTVIWDFAEKPISPGLLPQVSALLEMLSSSSGTVQAISPLLAPEEVEALRLRLDGLLTSGHFPAHDPYRRNVPWPWL